MAGRNAPPPEARSGGSRRELWIWCLILALALSLAEWFTYHRRITV